MHCPPFIDRRPLLVRIPHGGHIAAGDLEGRLGRAGMPVRDLRLQAAPYLPVTTLGWFAIHEDGTAIGGWLEMTYQYTADHVELIAELQVLDPEEPGTGAAAYAPVGFPSKHAQRG